MPEVGRPSRRKCRRQFSDKTPCKLQRTRWDSTRTSLAQAWLKPWKAAFADVLDCAISLGLLFFVVCSGLLVREEDGERGAVLSSCYHSLN